MKIEVTSSGGAMVPAHYSVTVCTSENSRRFRFREDVSGPPAQLAIVLRPLRWAVGNLRGMERRERVHDICEGFRRWQRLYA